MKGLRISDATREFHFKINTNQNTRIYVSIRTNLDVDVKNIDCEGFSGINF